MQFSVDDLVRLAKRENNSKRPYLYVNPVQGKHIPTDPRDTLGMCKALADIINNAYKDDRLYVIGFAETATGIAAGICSFMDNAVYYQNTTREYREGEQYLYFTESHSHATDQMLCSFGIEECIGNIDRIVFIDDEVTTGSTICKLIDIIKKRYRSDNVKYSIASVLNSMTSERIKELKENGIECIFLSGIPHEYKKDSIMNISFDKERHITITAESEPKYRKMTFIGRGNSRMITKFSEYKKNIMDYANSVIGYMDSDHFENVLVLGTEEFMYPTFCVGEMLIRSGIAENVRIHSTTRSPIVASDTADYPLYLRYQLRSLYDERRTTFIYNLKRYDRVIILTDTQEYNRGLWELCRALESVGNNNITVAGFVYKS